MMPSVLKRDLGSLAASVGRCNSGVPIKTGHTGESPNKDVNDGCLINPQGLNAGVLITFTAC